MTGFDLGAGLIFLVLALSGLWLRKAPGLLGARSGSLPDPAAEPSPRAYAVLAAALCAAAVAVRVVLFTAVPAGVNQDEAMAAVDAYALARYGTDRFGTWLPAHFEAWGYAQMSVLMSYLAVPFLWVFGLSIWAIRLPVLIVSLAGIWVLYRFAGSAFGRRAGLAALAVAAVNPWHILQSRWALDCNLMAHFTLFGIYGLYLGMKKRRWAYAGTACMALGMYSYGIAVYTLPVLLLGIAAYTLARRRYRVRDVLLCAGLFLLISWPIIGTMMINAFAWNTVELPFVTLQRFPASVRAGDLLFFTQDKPAQLAENAKSLGTIFLQGKDLPWNAVEGFGTVYGFGVWLMALALAAPAAERLWRLWGNRSLSDPADGADRPRVNASPPSPDGSAGGAMLGIWLAGSALSGLVVNGANVNRVNHIFYPLILLCALGAERLSRLGPRGTGLAAASVYGLAFCLFIGAYFGPHAQTLAWYNFNGFGASVQAAEASGAERLAVSARTLYGPSRQTAEILTMFYARTDARYFQGQPAEDGRLPYAERYTYVSLDLSPPVPAPDTAYIFHRTERELFSGGEYRLEEYGDHGLAIPLGQN
ncbi:MAG: glycosyltransferase family 39 protein [Oscillospiraceae bacterium]|nr:glycosyltransferase family 39 protein [Oscillospiraceae bacterium]